MLACFLLNFIVRHISRKRPVLYEISVCLSVCPFFFCHTRRLCQNG